MINRLKVLYLLLAKDEFTDEEQEFIVEHCYTCLPL